MSEEQAAALDEAAPEAVEATSEKTENTESEATENTEGQEDSQPAEGEKPEEEESESKKRRERRKAERARLRQEAAEAQKRAESAEERLARIQQAAQAQQPPKQDDFEDYNDYIAAAAAHKTMAAMDARSRGEFEEEAKAAKAEADHLSKEAEAQIDAEWQDQVADAQTRYADFANVVLANPNLPISGTMASVIKSSDIGADVAYHLGTHPQEAARIAQMEPLDQARAIGAIEARMSLPKPKTQSEAPEPITPVKPKGGNAVKDPSKMSMAEYRAWRAGKS